MKHQDRIIGIVFIAIAIVFYVVTMDFPEKSQGYPLIMISVMTILAVMLIIQSFIKKPEKSWKELFGHVHWKRFFFVFGSCFAYILLVNFIGFFVTTLSYLIITMVVLKANLKTILLAVPFFMLLIFLVFSVFLKVPLPTGYLI